MLVKVEGVVLEKIEIDKEYDGKPIKKKVVMLYQSGQKVNPQITLTDETFAGVCEGEKASFNCRAGAYSFNGRTGISLVEIGR